MMRQASPALLIPLLLAGCQATGNMPSHHVAMSLNSDSERTGAMVPGAPKEPSQQVAYVPKPVDPLLEIRKRMVNDADVSDSELKKLAESGDALAAVNYAKRHEAGSNPDSLATAATYYLKALHLGRDLALRPLIRLVKAGALNGSPTELADAQQTLDKLADKGNVFARVAMLDMYRVGTPFGPNPDRVEQLVAAEAEGGDTQAALDIALALLSGTPDEAEQEQARKYLKIAATSETLNIRTVAENLLRGLDTAPGQTVATETIQ